MTVVSSTNNDTSTQCDKASETLNDKDLMTYYVSYLMIDCKIRNIPGILSLVYYKLSFHVNVNN